MTSHVNTRPRSIMCACRVAACTNMQRRSEFSCPACWRALPGYLRDAIWRALREDGVGSDEHLQAVEDATAFLEGRDAERLS